jgi:hypothetical protein
VAPKNLSGVEWTSRKCAVRSGEADEIAQIYPLLQRSIFSSRPHRIGMEQK